MPGFERAGQDQRQFEVRSSARRSGLEAIVAREAERNPGPRIRGPRISLRSIRATGIFCGRLVFSRAIRPHNTNHYSSRLGVRFRHADKGGVVRLAELQSQGYLYLRP